MRERGEENEKDGVFPEHPGYFKSKKIKDKNPNEI